MTAAGSGGSPEYGDGTQRTPGPETTPTASFGPAPGPPPGAANTYPANPRTGEPRRWKGVVAAALIAGVVGGGVGVGGGMLIAEGGGTNSGITQHDPVTGTQVNAQVGTVQFAAGKASSSTVDITVRGARSGSEGTGVVLSPDGYVLTNNHVIGSGGEITVTLPDGTTRTASVVGTSPSYDLAVIKLNGASGLTPAELGKSSTLAVGQSVVAIGSPLGLEGTVTSGIVSALNRTVDVQGENGQPVIYNGIQTDASINSGNSGGPLVNLDGQVIGINTSIVSNSKASGNIGLGFAIPIDTASRVANELINGGVATKPQLGVTGTNGQSGAATISSVVPGSAADKAGLKAGETIVKVGNRAVSSFSDLVAQISSNAPASKINLTVADSAGGNQRQVEVTLGSEQDKAAETPDDSLFQQQNPYNSPNGGMQGDR